MDRCDVCGSREPVLNEFGDGVLCNGCYDSEMEADARTYINKRGEVVEETASGKRGR